MSFSLFTLYSKAATPKTQAKLTALLVFLLPFERMPSFNMLSITVRASQLVAAALIVVSIGPIIAFYKSKPRLPKLLLPAFIFGYFLSAILATDLKRAGMIFVFTLFAALVGSAVAATFSAEELPRLEKYLYISTVIVLAVGFYQYFGDVFGLSPALTGLRDIYTKEVFGFPRIQSTALEPLYYGSFLLIPYCLLTSRRLAAKTAKWWETVLLGTLACQIVLTVSRGAIYSAIITFGALAVGMLILKRTALASIIKALGVILLGALVALTLTWGASKLVDSKTTKYSASTKTQKLVDQATNLNSQNDRVRNRKIAIMAFKEQAVFGIGPGNFSQYAIARYPKYSKAAPIIVNNEPLELAAEAGIIGLTLFGLFIGWTYILAAIRYTKNRFKGIQMAYWMPAILAYFLALVVQYQTFSTLYIMHVWVAIGLLMAFGYQTNKSTE